MFFTCNWPSPRVTFLAGSVTQPVRHHSLMSINAGGINTYTPATTLQTKESWLSDIKLLQPRICSAFFFIYQVSHKTGRQRSQRSKILAQLLDWQESLNIARLPLAAPPQGSHSCSTLLCGAPAKQVSLPPWGLVTNDYLSSVCAMETVSITSKSEIYPSNWFWDPKAHMFS